MSYDNDKVGYKLDEVQSFLQMCGLKKGRGVKT